MKTARKMKNIIAISDAKELVKILEMLDENSRVLAKTYLSALVDRQQLAGENESEKTA